MKISKVQKKWKNLKIAELKKSSWKEKSKKELFFGMER